MGRVGSDISITHYIGVSVSKHAAYLPRTAVRTPNGLKLRPSPASYPSRQLCGRLDNL
ncbi:unnamed protein product [Lupinus luteus]|uniref:Uncharacterized protein n=1 Tax=Lupinus luteus TaxID=3873 RepID=A0AAV1XIQ1_LUPLU